MTCENIYDARLPIEGNVFSLYELADWKNGIAFRKDDFSPRGLPVIKIAELKHGVSGSTAWTECDFGEDAFLTKGDYVFSWSGNPETSIDIFRYNLQNGWLNQHIFKVIPKTKLVRKEFFFFLMKWLKRVFKQIAANKQTTGLGHITISDLKKIQVTIPSFEVQERIEHVLCPLDFKIMLNDQLNDYLSTLCEAVVSKKDGGRYLTLWDICHQVSDRVDYTDAKLETYVSTESLLQEKRGRRHAQSLPATGKVTHYKIGDTLISNIRPYFKKIWFASSEGTCSNDVLVFRADDPSNASFLYACLRQDSFFRHITQGVNGTKMPRGDKKQMMDFCVSDSCSPEDKHLIDSLVKQISENEYEAIQLQMLRDALLPKLISGEIDVLNPDLTQPTNNHLAAC